MSRRHRLIHFVDYVGGNQPWCAVTIGRAQVSCAVLTDAALEDLASDIRSSFWRRRRLRAESRADYAARQAARFPLAAE